VNWNEEAVEAAKGYLDTGSFSRNGLIQQLSSSYGDGFTRAQAVYAVNKAYH
jgi:Host cell surface-exposed lipoprotein